MVYQDGPYHDGHDPARLVLPGLGKAAATESNLSTESGTGLHSLGRTGRRVLTDPPVLVIRHPGSWNSRLLASEARFIRVVIPQMSGASIDWIDQGATTTWRGRYNLW